MARIAVADGVAKRSGSAIAAALIVLTGCFVAPIALFGLRRCMGAFQQPLPPAMLIAACLAALCLAWLVRAAWSNSFPDRTAVRWLPSALLVSLAVALWLPGTTTAAAGTLTAMVALDCFLAIVLDGPPLQPFLGRFDRARLRQPATLLQATRLVDASLVQSWTRRRAASGEETIEATLRAEFPPGQRTEHCHLAICPAMQAAPTLRCEQLAGPAARIKVAQVLPHGARIELKLAEVAPCPTQVLLRVTARGSLAHQPRTQA